MAERPDPDTDRRNILPGEHAKPDGTWCPYLAPSNEAGVWVCMKCGNSGGVSTPDTDWATLADELNMDADYWVRLHADQPKRPGFDWMLELAGRERAAADGLRQYAAITADDGRPLADHERSRWTAGEVRQMIQHAEELEAQLAAITAAIGNANDLRRTARFLDTYQSTRYAAMLLSSSIAAAAAVTAPDTKEPTDG